METNEKFHQIFKGKKPLQQTLTTQSTTATDMIVNSNGNLSLRRRIPIPPTDHNLRLTLNNKQVQQSVNFRSEPQTQWKDNLTVSLF